VRGEAESAGSGSRGFDEVFDHLRARPSIVER
jgi:hypothetical protein